MKKLIIISLSLAVLLTGCTVNDRKADEGENKNTETTMTREGIKAASFDELFQSIEPAEIPGDVFTLIGKDFTVITAGIPEHYNSMVASWGGWGILFNKPATWCFLRASRYTLELMRKDDGYTMSYFEEDYKDDFMPFGEQTGRNGNKMQESKLTAVETPEGNMAFKEAKLIIECKMVQETTISPDDFKTDEGRKFVIDAHIEVGEYHKLVFGEITKVWVKKN